MFGVVYACPSPRASCAACARVAGRQNGERRVPIHRKHARANAHPDIHITSGYLAGARIVRQMRAAASFVTAVYYGGQPSRQSAHAIHAM
eukprot:scaffold216763_cov34-Tisochrysis_lutea.AAC.1